MIENIQSHQAYDEPMAPTPRKRNRNPLDSRKAKALHSKVLTWWNQAREDQADNRLEQALDADFKDGLQWSDEDAQILRERGQAPLVYNRIKPAVDWVLGTEKRGRMDFKVHGREDDDTKEAETKTSLLKYLSDVNQAGEARSRAFDEAVTSGLGWLEDGIRADDSDEPIFSRAETWRNMWYDRLGVERDLSDARYVFRSKYVDLDIAIAMFPSRARTLQAAADKSSPYGDVASEDEFLSDAYNQRGYSEGVLVSSGRAFTNGEAGRRPRVRLIECWYREPKNMQVLRGDSFAGKEFDPANVDMGIAIEDGYASVYDAVVMKMRLVIMTEDAMLMSEDSPYEHNDFPFTPVWGYRRNRDNAPYGMVRNIRDPQENLNKRMSKALHILSSNQIIAHEDATSDWDEIREEAARPDGMLLLDGRKDALFELKQDKQLAQGHIDLMNLDAQMIQDVAGVTDENLGRQTNATSGRAVNARQEQGAIVTAELFDNHRQAFQTQGAKQLALIEQFYSQAKTIRIVGDDGQPAFTELNGLGVNPESGEIEELNPMTRAKADFIVDEQEYRATQRRAMFDMFSELFKSLDPEVTVNLMDLMFEYSDLPGREEIVSRIRKLNGQSDPNKKDDPEQQQLAQQQQQEESQQKEFEMQGQQLDLQRKGLDNEKVTAEIGKVKADTVGTNVEALYQAITVGGQIAIQPAAASIGDQVAASAGFIDQDQAPIFPQDVPKQLAPMTRQERTVIQKQMGVDSDNDGNPMTQPKGAPSSRTDGMKGSKTARPTD